MSKRDVVTPPRSLPIGFWLRAIPVGDVAYVFGACSRVMAEHEKVSEADLLAEFARLAAADPDASIIPS